MKFVLVIMCLDTSFIFINFVDGLILPLLLLQSALTLIHSGYVSRPSVDVWNHGQFQASIHYDFFPYIHTSSFKRTILELLFGMSELSSSRLLYFGVIIK